MLAGHSKKVKDKTYSSRVDIELVNEQVKLFYSALDEVSIAFDHNTFSITEYLPLGLNDKTSYYPLENRRFIFMITAIIKLKLNFFLEPPQYNRKMLLHIYNSNLSLLSKLEKSLTLSDREKKGFA